MYAKKWLKFVCARLFLAYEFLCFLVGAKKIEKGKRKRDWVMKNSELDYEGIFR